jgi:hypothetical protein
LVEFNDHHLFVDSKNVATIAPSSIAEVMLNTFAQSLEANLPYFRIASPRLEIFQAILKDPEHFCIPAEDLEKHQ